MLHPTESTFISLAVLALVGVWGVFTWNGGFDKIDAIAARHPSIGIPGPQSYAGLDRGLVSIAAFNLSAVHPQARVFMVQFLSNLTIIPIILCTEDSHAASDSLVR